MTNHARDAAGDSTLEALLDRVAAVEGVQSNCMFQLAMMLARIAIEPCAEAYKEESAQALLAIIRGKPKSNVVRLFGSAPQGGGPVRAAGAAMRVV